MTDAAHATPEADTAAPHVSICIVNWNRRDMLRALLDSIGEHAGLPCEIIIVDNASTDGSQAMITADFPQVQLIENAQQAGFARANNQAAAIARGPLLLFLNNDTLLRPGALPRLAALFQQPHVVAAGPALVDADGALQPYSTVAPGPGFFFHQIQALRWTGLFRGGHRRCRLPAATAQKTDADHPVEWLYGAAVMVRASAFRTVGGWDERFTFGGEDIDLGLRLRQHGALIYDADAAIVHHGGAATRTTPGYPYRGMQCSRAVYLRLRGSPAISRIYKLLYTLDTPVRMATSCAVIAIATVLGKTRRRRAHWMHLKADADFLLRGLPAFLRS